MNLSERMYSQNPQECVFNVCSNVLIEPSGMCVQCVFECINRTHRNVCSMCVRKY